MNKIIELFWHQTHETTLPWNSVISQQFCKFTRSPCYKTRKSDPGIAIGTCSVAYGTPLRPLIICPTRLTENGKIFMDAIHLLTNHEPGNDLHLVPEISIPGGNVDYFLVSVRGQEIRDFVGIELQTLDTTGSIWPARVRQVASLLGRTAPTVTDTGFGMNWKMTAKTILMQMHHKSATFELIGKKILLVVQREFFDYMTVNFNFSHVSNPAQLGNSVHFHTYSMENNAGKWGLVFNNRFSTNSDGINRCLGLQAEPRVEYEEIIRTLGRKISTNTLFIPFGIIG